MANTESEGRTVLWAVSAFMIAVPMYFLLVKAPATGQVTVGTIRLAATAPILYLFLKGKNWARFTLAFFALTGAAYLDVRLAFFHESFNGREVMELLIKDIGYTAAGLFLVFSRSFGKRLNPMRRGR